MIEAPAIFSPCRRWRYTLCRSWPGLLDGFLTDKKVAFIGLNPSTADETNNDPTVRRCIGFAKRWGYGGMFMLNIFAWRSTEPKALYALEDPVGPENDHYINLVVSHPDVSLVVACWGHHGALINRGPEVIKGMEVAGIDLYRLGSLTIPGAPRHPLYLKADLFPEPL